MSRSEEDKVLRAPILVTLGGEERSIRPLVLRESRAWRAKVAQALGDIPRWASATTDNPDEFKVAMEAMMVALPDTVSDLFFDYAKELIKEEIENVATDAELAKAFQEVVSLAFPLVGSLVGMMTGGLQSQPEKLSSSS